MIAEEKRNVYNRVLEAGDAEVVKILSLRRLRQDQHLLSANSGLTHVFMDANQASDENFAKISRQVEQQKLKIKFLNYKYIFMLLKGKSDDLSSPWPPSESLYQISVKRSRSQKKADRARKKPRGEDRVKEKAVITIDLEEEEEDIVVVGNGTRSSNRGLRDDGDTLPLPKVHEGCIMNMITTLGNINLRNSMERTRYLIAYVVSHVREPSARLCCQTLTQISRC